MKRQRKTAIHLVTLGVCAVLIGHTAMAQPANDPFTDEFGPWFGAAVRVPPTPRSLNMPGVFGANNEVVMPPLGPGDILFDDGTGSPPINGRVYPVGINTANDGLWTDLPDGGRLWTFTVSSPNAEGLRLRFEPFHPPPGVELILYNANNPNEAYGPIGAERARTGLPYWAPTVYGLIVRVEYYVPAEVVRTRMARAHLQITGVVQEFPHPVTEPACRLDVMCDSSWSTTRLAVAHIHFVSGASSFICSGAMINRNPAFDATPLFLTASHCINTAAEANSIDVFWLYETASCNGTDPGHASVPRTDGSILLANASDPDLTLLGLTMDDIPGGLVWAGWSSAAVSFNLSGTSIHHPAGVRKSISYGVFEANQNSCGSPINTTYRFDLSDGGQEGGSSGGPVFDNANHRIRAVVSCSQSGCTFDENTWEGRFSSGFSTLSPFLSASSDVWVDIAWGGTERGTMAQPWDTTPEGHFGVAGGGRVHIVAGTYPAKSFLGTKSLELVAEGGSVIIGG